jgi:distribution and morphology protein 10
MLGHISGAYAARVSRDLSLGSRFDFNVYSYESEWTMGAEWWLRRARQPEGDAPADAPAAPGVTGVVKARVSTSNVCPSLFLFPERGLTAARRTSR